MLWSLLACSFFADSEPPANVVLIVVDTMRADHVGVYGSGRSGTPTVDRLAKEGQFFTRAYAHSGWTLPSMTSVFTGTYPHEHRVGRSPLSQEEFGSLSSDATTMAELFQRHKYSTAAVINNTFLAPTFGLNQGFEDYFYFHKDSASMLYRTAKESTDTAIDWWKKTQGPKFLVLHYMEPHMDLHPPEHTKGRFLTDPSIPIPFGGKDAFDITQKLRSGQSITTEQEEVKRLYDEEILAVDVEIERFVDAVKEDKVLFAFTSDHGEEFWEQGGFEHGHHVGSLLTRIPLIFWGEGIEKRGEIDAVVSHVDLFHSLLAASGITPPEETHGISILNQDSIPAQEVMSENTLYGDPQLSIVNRDYRLEINQKTNSASVWRLDSNGVEQQVLVDDIDAIAVPLYEKIEKIRGGIQPVEQVAGPVIPDHEAFLQLKKLGYLKE